MFIILAQYQSTTAADNNIRLTDMLLDMASVALITAINTIFMSKPLLLNILVIKIILKLTIT